MKKLSFLFITLLLVGCKSSSNNYKGTWENIIANDVLTFNGVGYLNKEKSGNTAFSYYLTKLKS